MLTLKEGFEGQMTEKTIEIGVVTVPTAAELAIGTGYLTRARRTLAEAPAWEAYCQLLLCANEFIYVD